MGQLGREICGHLGPAAVPPPRLRLDLAQPAAIRGVVQKLRPEVVIYGGVWTAVDAAESTPDVCRRVNADVVGSQAAPCNTVDAMLVQISTGYVFGAHATRASPYFDADALGPMNQYGAGKLAAEKAAATASKQFIVTTRSQYSDDANGPVRGRNFADTMLAPATERKVLRIVDDQHCTTSFVPQIAEGNLRILARRANGRFDVVNSRSTTWHSFASELFLAAGRTMSLRLIPSSGYQTAAKRPDYSVLDTNKFSASTGVTLPQWQTTIQEYLQANKPYFLN